jgi:hypothetical protein
MACGDTLKLGWQRPKSEGDGISIKKTGARVIFIISQKSIAQLEFQEGLMTVINLKSPTFIVSFQCIIPVR